MNREGHPRTAREYAKHLRPGDVINHPSGGHQVTVARVDPYSPSTVQISLYEHSTPIWPNVTSVFDVLAGPSTQLDATVWDQEQAAQASQPEPAAASAKPKKRRRWPWIAAVPVAFFVGVMLGVAPTDTTTPAPPTNQAAAEPEPAPTVTVTPEPKVVTKTETKWKTRTVTKKVVPQSCRDAMDAGWAMTDWIAELGAAMETLDVAEMERLGDQAYDIGADWGLHAELCRQEARR